MPDLSKKIFISLKSAAFFVLLNLPIMYQTTNKLFGNTWNAATACPTPLGVVIHAGVFYLLSYFSMRNPSLSKQQKMHHALKGALLFAILSSAPVYRFTSSIVPSIAGPSGCPSVFGVVVHGLVLAAVLVGLMSLKK